MKNIYGTIGYTMLENINKHKIIVLADMHDTLPYCKNQINISDWFKTKFESSKILLEEVPRDNFELEELWSNSLHTRELKKLFINNSQIIHAVDIRPYLIPFSWELINSISDDDITFKKYMYDIDNFFCIKLPYFINKLDNYNKDKLIHSKLGKHFLIIKKKYRFFLNNNKNNINLTIKQINSENIGILYQINEILDEIMELYICSNIILNKSKPIILHAGLAHSEKVIEWLIKHYNYIERSKQGVNLISESSDDMDGCIQLSPNIDNQFGGFYN
jgi:hypothetical protein